MWTYRHLEERRGEMTKATREEVSKMRMGEDEDKEREEDKVLTDLK